MKSRRRSLESSKKPRDAVSFLPIMRSSLLAIAALAAVFGGMLWFRVGNGAGSGKPDATAADAPFRSSGRRPPATTIERMRRLRDSAPDRAPSFDEVDTWARKLTDGELRELVGETGMEDHTGLIGWLRCALFAEWGRRDPEAAAGFLNSLDWPGGNFHYAFSQSWFSLYRGWAGVDPEAARVRLESSIEAANTFPSLPGTRGFDEQAQKAARTAVYRKLAELEPDGLWDVGSLTPDGLLDPVVMKGVLTGATSPRGLASFVERWTTDVLHAPGYEDELRRYNNATLSSFSGFIVIPARETIVRQIARTLADRDLETALAWLGRNDPEIGTVQANRVFNFLNDWARLHPQQALERIASKADPKRDKVLAYGAFAGDFTLGPEILRLFPEANDRRDIILTAMSEGSNHHVDDFYPAPGRPNRIRDISANHQAVLATISAAEFPPEKEAELSQRTHLEFSQTVPAANAAALGN